MSQPLKPKQCHKVYYDAFALNLKYYRNKLGLTQAQAAELAGISTKYLSLLESAFFENIPSIEVMINLAEAFHVKVFQLFKPLS